MAEGGLRRLLSAGVREFVSITVTVFVFVIVCACVFCVCMCDAKVWVSVIVEGRRGRSVEVTIRWVAGRHLAAESMGSHRSFRNLHS